MIDSKISIDQWFPMPVPRCFDNGSGTGIGI